MILTELDDDIAIRHLEGPEDAARWRAPFIGAYQTVFGGFPYFERFYPQEAEGIYRKFTSTPQNISILATRQESQVVGFSIAVPLASVERIAVHLTGLVPIPHTFYLAELGVLEGYRKRGIGSCLTAERLKRIDRDRYSHVVLRVSANNNPSADMYRTMGFEDVGVHMDVRSPRTDGRVTTDRRMFMSRMLSQVEL